MASVPRLTGGQFEQSFRGAAGDEKSRTALENTQSEIPPLRSAQGRNDSLNGVFTQTLSPALPHRGEKPESAAGFKSIWSNSLNPVKMKRLWMSANSSTRTRL